MYGKKYKVIPYIYLYYVNVFNYICYWNSSNQRKSLILALLLSMFGFYFNF